jgi:hypothetical protein
MQAIDRAPRWALKRLTATYVTLGLSDIARAVNIESEDEVREVVLSMVGASHNSHLHVTHTYIHPIFNDDVDV